MMTKRVGVCGRCRPYESEDSELEASVKRLFDESGVVDQGDSATGRGPKTESKIVVGVRIVDEENVAAEKHKRLRKKRQVVADAGGLFHPPKKLRSDHRVSAGAEVMATLPFVTSSVSAIPEHESGVPVDFVTGLNLRTTGPSERFVISSDSSHHSSINASGAEDNSIIRSDVIPPVMTEVVVATHVASIPCALTPEPSAAGSSHVPGKELSMGSREVDSESLHEVFVRCWNIPNDSLLDNLDASRKFIDHLAPLVLFAQIHDMDYEELFTEFSVGTTQQAYLNAEVRMLTEYSLNENRRLESDYKKQAGLLRTRDDEIEGLKAQLLLKEAEATEAIRLRAKVSKYEAVEKSLHDEIDAVKDRNAILENEQNALDVKVADLEASAKGKECELIDLNSLPTSVKSQNDIPVDQVSSSGLQEKVTVYKNCMEQLERFQDDRMKIVNDKFDQLYIDSVEMALHLEEKFYPHLLTTISGRRWLITQGMELAVVKCLNSPE
uniref:Transposase (Putative), gypsy type n=1 Tax=Tanacetum cinerariifolium TaxID=118510 RepID=A0A699JGT3_TANCI|nr:hypothetical protein [Tanacetum cinerariifolium]